MPPIAWFVVCHRDLGCDTLLITSSEDLRGQVHRRTRCSSFSMLGGCVVHHYGHCLHPCSSCSHGALPPPGTHQKELGHIHDDASRQLIMVFLLTQLCRLVPHSSAGPFTQAQSRLLT